MKFTKKQIDRYSRQIILKKIGVTGQKKLLKASRTIEVIKSNLEGYRESQMGDIYKEFRIIIV